MHCFATGSAKTDLGQNRSPYTDPIISQFFGTTIEAGNARVLRVDPAEDPGVLRAAAAVRGIPPGTLRSAGARLPVRGISVDIWLFLQIGGPFCGCPQNKSPTFLGSILGPLILGNSHI